jgi:hypothetical protein
MDNKIPPPPSKPLNSGFCYFCYFVRGRGRVARTHGHAGARGEPQVHNNKNNKNVYINRLEGSSVSRVGIA